MHGLFFAFTLLCWRSFGAFHLVFRMHRRTDPRSCQ
jgi:hypothetical protein